MKTHCKKCNKRFIRVSYLHRVCPSGHGKLLPIPPVFRDASALDLDRQFPDKPRMPRAL